MNVCFGVDVGGTLIKFGMFDANGNLLEKWEATTPKNKSVFEEIANNILKKATENRLLTSNILGVGLGVPGPVNDEGYAEILVNLNLRDINVSHTLSGLLDGIPVISTNDANLAALGEMWKGAGRNCDNMMLITLGTGVGSGLIINRRLVNGYRGVAGEIGHIICNPCEVAFCNCGSLGCLDQVASVTGLVRYTRFLLEAANQNSKSILHDLPTLTSENIVCAAKEGDRVSLQALQHTMGFLGKMIADMGQIIDPEIFIIGGGLSYAGEFLLDIIREKYLRNLVFSKKQAKVVLAELRNDAGIFGGAKLILDNVNQLERYN